MDSVKREVKHELEQMAKSLGKTIVSVDTQTVSMDNRMESLEKTVVSIKRRIETYIEHPLRYVESPIRLSRFFFPDNQDGESSHEEARRSD